MAEDPKNIAVISKKNSGFPDYLDFDKLRTEGIDYLGRLGGKLWTDHNVHDPGITILEMLCYALLDLGYRTNLPEADLFARNPEDKTPDNNFYTPAQILACNPLTITDFRKLLVDIEGVKNAWLEVATNEHDGCRPVLPNDPNLPGIVVGGQSRTKDCVDYLNGLYHVSIDLEKDVELIKDPAEKQHYLDTMRDKIKNALMEHRNLCEDFIDIRFLCKYETGVCADIELDDNADVEKVYLDTVEQLRTFFSPAPHFYTLQELLDKDKPIDEIFAGRPYNITESHGFVDTAEFEQLKLKREIHLSDVYSALFEVAGVKSVTRLRLRNCVNPADPGKDSGWKYHLPKNHVPEFSVTCSSFRFTKKGMPVFIDFKKYEGLLAINFTHNGKVLYQSPSPYLDAAIPKGVYREDIGEYYSVQNEFPQVYGIGEGGLPDSASAARKAQAYQLKAYLLFFDQLLANYLAQLQHMRSLFAMSAPADEDEKHTYFSSQLNSVPDLQKLLRFNISDTNSNPLGTEGSLLVLPVDKGKLLDLIEQDQLKNLEIESLAAYQFNSLADQEIAISQVKDDLFFEQHQCRFVSKTDNCIFYYIITSSDDIALISRKYFKNEREAGEHAASVKYIGTFDENYRTIAASGNSFSFQIELNLLSFSKYLQLIAEDRRLFYQRRQGFLDHLLSRFAEQFADYALLSFGFLNTQQSSAAIIKHKEKFLSNYDDLSSNRGRAYNYLENNWNNNNVSGFEKKFKSLAGIENWKRHNLCNFVVDQYESQFTVTLNIAGTRYFSTAGDFDTKEEAQTAAQQLFNAMPDPANYAAVPVAHDNAYQLAINYAKEGRAIYPVQFATEAAVNSVIGNITGLFRERPAAEAVFISSFVYVPQLTDAAGNKIRKSVNVYPSPDEAKADALKAVNKINDHKKWTFDEQAPALGNLYRNNRQMDALSFINTGAFKFDINNSIVGKPDKFTYSVLDRENNFKLNAAKEFDTSDKAGANANELLALLADEKNYQAFTDKISGKYLLRIVDKEDLQAICANESATAQEAADLQKKIAQIVNSQQYSISIEEVPDTWKFRFQLGYEQSSLYVFHSKIAYKNPGDAAIAADIFNKGISNTELHDTADGLELVPEKNVTNTNAVVWQAPPGISYTPAIKTSVEKLLAAQKEIKVLVANPHPEAFSNSVVPDAAGQQGDFVYRLVDKDRLPAAFSKVFFTAASAAAGIKEVIAASKNYDGYLQVCMGGDIIVKRKHPVTNTTWYRYQLICTNQFYASGKPLVLFESAGRYASAEEAEKAFNENYLQLIHIASSAGGYTKKISTEEIPIDAADGLVKSGNIAFIPKETLEEKGGTAATAIKFIMELVLTYPVRMTAFQSEEFYRLFPCETGAPETDPADCISKTESWVYYFVFITGSPSGDYWQSNHYYYTATEAMEAFDFFRVLLYYSGNYYADCDHCQDTANLYKIYLREVLAESAERFLLEQDAWGVAGVQKFICVAQSDNSFHTYATKDNCCHSFYTACGDGLAYHPCKYDKPKQRDEILLKLYQLSNEWQKKRSWQWEDNGDSLDLFNENGEAFARMASGIQRNRCSSDAIADLVEVVGNTENYGGENGRLFLRGNNQEILVWSVQEGIEIEGWRKMLQVFICYYPVVKTKNERTDNNRWCIEIKLPGFNTCKEDATEESPCGCGERTEEIPNDCYIAWKSTCCYTNCAEAEAALLTLHRLLLNYACYQPVFDCDCGSYGVTIQFTRAMVIDDQRITWFQEEANTRNWQNSEIIAVNPQCYPGAEAACNAVRRAKNLINSEGLHLVEHILLRPRCLPQDCQCRSYSKGCDNKTGCEFEWMVPDDDPCSEEKDICFTPGADKYSFIATVALPAWPDRFRKPENRRLLENMLYREAPAHVLLRIVWLAPHDFCCFETKFKNWNRWLAQKETCIDDFSVCDFLDFLFERNYECLDECSICFPCDDNVQQPASCFNNNLQRTNEPDFLDLVNDIYCLTDQDCEKYRFAGCESEVQVPDFVEDELTGTDDMINLETSDVLPLQPVAEKEVEEKPTRKSKTTQPLKATEEKERTTLPSNSSVSNAKSKAQGVNSRLNKYRTNIAAILAKTNNHPLAMKAQSFIADPSPSPDRLLKLVTEIIQNKVAKNKTAKALLKKQVYELLRDSICYYLDKICFNGRDMAKLKVLKAVFEKLHKAKINTGSIYEYWNLPEVKLYEPALNEEEVKHFFDAAKK